MLPLVLAETRGAAYRLLTAPTLVGLGVISYGLYLYHVPVLGEIEHYALTNQIDFFGHPVMGTIVCALSFSIPLAMASYRYFELPSSAARSERSSNLPLRLPLPSAPSPDHMPSHQTLSFAITTSGPAARVRTLLEWVRPHVDEIVLAADRDGDPDVLDACADLADRRLRFELRTRPPASWDGSSTSARPTGSCGWTTTRCPRPHCCARSPS